MNKIKKISIITLFLSLLSYQNTNSQVINVNLENPASKFSSVSALISTFVDWIINLGIVAVTLAFVYVGFQFVAARGNADQIKKSRDAFFWTVIGTLVLIGGKVLVEVIKNTLQSGGITTT